MPCTMYMVGAYIYLILAIWDSVKNFLLHMSKETEQPLVKDDSVDIEASTCSCTDCDWYVDKHISLIVSDA